MLDQEDGLEKGEAGVRENRQLLALTFNEIAWGNTQGHTAGKWQT